MWILILLVLFSLSFSKTFTYGVKVLWFEVGEIKITIEKDKAVAVGRTYKSFEWLYKYDFEFVSDGKKLYLYEKEKHPILTDLKYVYLAAYNIFSNKIRSA